MSSSSSSSCVSLCFSNPEFSHLHHHHHHHHHHNLHLLHRSATHFRWQFKRGQDASFVARRTKRQQAFRLLANPNTMVSPSKGSSKEVIMVDPLEAKRLAAKQMEEIQAEEKFKRKRQIEAINGAWAMIGLTAGLVIEGQTGKSILAQLVGYWDAIVNLIMR